MNAVFNFFGALLAIGLLIVFIWGACRHVVEQVVARHPRLAEPAPRAKTQKYALATVQVLWNILVPVATGLFGFLAAGAEHGMESTKNETQWYDGCLWQRDACGVWYSHGADDDSTPPSNL